MPPSLLVVHAVGADAIAAPHGRSIAHPGDTDVDELAGAGALVAVVGL
jgi:hypothetical protein